VSRDSLAGYYARRAAEYDSIYAKPERQDDIGLLADSLTQLLAGRVVLEVACGTGFWTQFVAKGAASIVATDINKEVLEIARHRLAGASNVTLAESDAFSLEGAACHYTGAMAAFWWSHLPKSQIKSFLGALGRHLEPGARVVFADNLYVPGNSTSISRTDPQGNSYQLRRLQDGSTHEVVKNFPAESQFLAAVNGFGRNASFRTLQHFWYGWYEAS
jgi:ubiquinone/menaquinone biosynthesis C-methylase UbiE